ncbi:hypothetical protein ACA31_01050 [Staphylococcus sp. NAM3COL9]|nr:hypothetical protein ACA31_01050 [Staphylococcus sp. NAM3COL9]
MFGTHINIYDFKNDNNVFFNVEVLLLPHLVQYTFLIKTKFNYETIQRLFIKKESLLICLLVMIDYTNY